MANAGKRRGGFKTLPDVVSSYRVVCAACDKDKPKNRGPVVLWDRIWDQYLAPHHPDNDGELNLVIHHGGACGRVVGVVGCWVRTCPQQLCVRAGAPSCRPLLTGSAYSLRRWGVGAWGLCASPTTCRPSVR